MVGSSLNSGGGGGRNGRLGDMQIESLNEVQRLLTGGRPEKTKKEEDKKKHCFAKSLYEQ